MKLLRGTAVFLLTIILAITIFILSLSLALNYFLYPGIYFKAFEKADLYPYIDKNLNNSQIFIAFPKEGSRPIIENILSNFIEYMRSNTNTLNLSVTIDQDKLRGFFLNSINKTRVCLPNQNPFNEKDPCLPKDKSPSEFLDEFLEDRNLSFLESAQVDLTKVYSIESGSDGRENIDKIRRYVSKYNLLQIMLLVVSIVSLTLIYIIQRPNNKKFLRTVSIIFIIVSLSIFTLTYSINNLSDNIPLKEPILTSLLNEAINVFNNKLMIFSLSLSILAILLFVTSFFVSKNLKSKTPNKPNKK